MERIGDVTVRFIAGFGPIIRDAEASRRLYRQTLGIAFREEGDGYLHTEELPVGAPAGARSALAWLSVINNRGSTTAA